MNNKWILLSALAITGAANAAQPDLSLGLGIGHQDSIYRGIDSKTSGLPFVAYKNGNFFVRGLEAGYYFGDTTQSPLKFGALVRYRVAGYDADDSDFLFGMSDRKSTLEAGLMASYETVYGQFGAAALGDIADKHDGYELSMGWNKPYFLDRHLILTPQLGVSWRSSDFNNYYFGVTNQERNVALNRNAYKPGSGFVYSAGVSATYIINQNNMLILGTTYDRYGSEVKKSPIVSGSSTWETGLVYSYRF